MARPLADGFQEGESALLEQRCCFLVEVAEAAIGEQVTVAWMEQRAAMLTVAVQEYIADVRPVFGERTA